MNTNTTPVAVIASPSIDADYVLSLGGDRKTQIAALVELGDDKRTATQTVDAAIRIRAEAQSASLAESLTSRSAMVLKSTRLKDGSLSVKIADRVTADQARARTIARYAALTAKALAKLS